MATEKKGFPELASNPSQPEVVFNQLAREIEGKEGGMVSRTRDAQPTGASVTAGDTYIMTANASGTDWTAYATSTIAHYYNGAWYNYTPQEGWDAWINDEDLFMAFNGAAWVSAGGGGGETNTASNLGGVGWYASKSGSDLEFKGIVAGANVTVSATASTIIVTASVVGGGETNTASNLGGTGWYANKSGANLQFKGIEAGDSSINVSATSSSIRIFASVTDTGEVNTVSNLGGTSWYAAKSGSDLEFKGITAGTNIIVSVLASSLRVSASIAGGSGETNTARSAAGSSVYLTKTGSELVFRGLTAGGNVAISTLASSLRISSTDTGEVNTVRNMAATGLYASKSGSDLEFKGLINGSSALTITSQASTLTLDVDDTKVDHDVLLNFAADEHVAHSTVSAIAGEGLSGGGNLSADFTYKVNISALAAEAGADGATDYVMVHHASTGTLKKVLLNNLPGGGSGETNTASNRGATLGWYAAKSGSDLEFRVPTAGSGIAITSTNASTVSFACNASVIQRGTTANFTAGYTTDIETLASTAVTSTVSPDLGLEYLKKIAINADWTLKGASETTGGACLIKATVDGTSGRTIAYTSVTVVDGAFSGASSTVNWIYFVHYGTGEDSRAWIWQE